MSALHNVFFDTVGVFFMVYLLIYATYLFLSIVVGALRLYYQDRKYLIKNELKTSFYIPVSILVPAYNEEVTILDSVLSLLNLDYKLYEIIVIDDGSTDSTSQILINHFHMDKVDRTIEHKLSCEKEESVYEAAGTKVKLTLIRKQKGGKGDSINMGINACDYPYFVCIDADSMLQRNSLERIVQPVMKDDNVVAVGGMIRIAQCVKMKNGNVLDYHLPWNILVSAQVMEYDRSFLASRLFMDVFNGNLIISGAFGLFKKDIVIATGGYDDSALGEDMELVMKLHTFCRNNKHKYSIRYEPDAICWSQAPESLKDLKIQRRRWHLGLYECMMKYRKMFLNPVFGLAVLASYLYYLMYELLSPLIEIFGLIVVVAAGFMGLLNWPFMIHFFLLYAVYGAVITMTAFYQRIYTQNIKICRIDILKASVFCLFENVFLHVFMDFVRGTAFVKYKKKKNQWGQIKRVRRDEMC